MTLNKLVYSKGKYSQNTENTAQILRRSRRKCYSTNTAVRP